MKLPKRFQVNTNNLRIIGLNRYDIVGFFDKDYYVDSRNYDSISVSNINAIIKQHPGWLVADRHPLITTYDGVEVYITERKTHWSSANGM